MADETARQRDIRLLRILAEHDSSDFSLAHNSPKDLLALNALLAEKFRSSKMIEGDFEGDSYFPAMFVDTRISIKGRAYLEEQEQKEDDLWAARF